MCMFQYTIWWTTRAFDCCWFDYVTSEPAPTTVLLRAARQLQITYHLRRGYQSNTTTRLQANYVILWRGYPTTINYYYSDTNELQASTRLHINYQLRGDQSTTTLNHTTSSQTAPCFTYTEFTSSVYKLWCSIHVSTHLQPFTTTAVSYTIIWHYVPVLLFLSVMISNSLCFPSQVMMFHYEYQCWWCHDNPVHLFQSCDDVLPDEGPWRRCFFRRRAITSQFATLVVALYCNPTWLVSFFGLRLRPPPLGLRILSAPVTTSIFIHFHPVVRENVVDNVIQWW